MRDDVTGVELDFDGVFGFADLDAAPDPIDRDRVAAGVQCDLAFDINDAFMKPVDVGNPDRKRFQMQPFDGEQLARNGTDNVFCMYR